MMSEARRENNTDVNRKEIKKIIKALSSAKKSSPALLYFCILFSALLAILVAINMHTNSVFDSLFRFCFFFSAISIFFIFLNSYLNKVSIMSGLYVVNQWIDCMSRNDWNHPFPRHLHPLILIHPVFRVIAGLYFCKTGNNDDGVAMINKAASELPEINDCVSEGEISNTTKFGQLSNRVKQDLMPSAIFSMFLKVFLVLGALSILIRVIVYILNAFL